MVVRTTPLCFICPKFHTLYPWGVLSKGKLFRNLVKINSLWSSRLADFLSKHLPGLWGIHGSYRISHMNILVDMLTLAALWISHGGWGSIESRKGWDLYWDNGGWENVEPSFREERTNDKMQQDRPRLYREKSSHLTCHSAISSTNEESRTIRTVNSDHATNSLCSHGARTRSRKEREWKPK